MFRKAAETILILLLVLSADNRPAEWMALACLPAFQTAAAGNDPAPAGSVLNDDCDDAGPPADGRPARFAVCRDNWARLATGKRSFQPDRLPGQPIRFLELPVAKDTRRRFVNQVVPAPLVLLRPNPRSPPFPIPPVVS